MRAIILAAGRGERMRPLTDKMPKPLLEVAGKPLILHQLESLRDAGVKECVINLGHLGYQIRDYLGEGKQYDISIQYSDEGDNLLETGGGIIKALPLLGEAPFITVNADIYTEFDYASLVNQAIPATGHLILVDNPPQHLAGDFALADGRVMNEGKSRLTYSGIGLFKPAFFNAHLAAGRCSLAPWLRSAVDQGLVSGEHFQGVWSDVGTPDRLNEINMLIGSKR